MAGKNWINGTIGVRYTRNCHPDDLWKTYFTSSKHVQEFRELYGEPDVIQIRQTFNDSLQAREWEHKVLRRIGVIGNDGWLNKTTGNGKFCNTGHSQETKKKISDAKQNMSQEHRQRISESKKGKVLCLDIQTGIKARISSELFHSDKTRYFGSNSKVYNR